MLSKKSFCIIGSNFKSRWRDNSNGNSANGGGTIPGGGGFNVPLNAGETINANVTGIVINNAAT